MTHSQGRNQYLRQVKNHCLSLCLPLFRQNRYRTRTRQYRIKLFTCRPTTALKGRGLLYRVARILQERLHQYSRELYCTLYPYEYRKLLYTVVTSVEYYYMPVWSRFPPCCIRACARRSAIFSMTSINFSLLKTHNNCFRIRSPKYSPKKAIK